MDLDQHLMAAMERLFANSEARVVTAIEVGMKQSGSNWAVTKTQKQLKSRVLCITAKRSKKKNGFRCKLNIVKENKDGADGEAPYQVRKSWGLKALSRIELLKAGDGLKSGSGCFFQLTFTSSMSTGLSETKLEYGVETLEERALFLACIYRLVMEQKGRPPGVVGADVSDLERLGHNEAALALLGKFGSELLREDDGAAEEHRVEVPALGRNAGSQVSEAPEGEITTKEELDLKRLLERFQVGIGDVEGFMLRLGDELKDMESANIRSILESSDTVRGLVRNIDRTINLLDDMDAQMLVYNERLLHMREDVAAIELRNNRLEVAVRNSTALLKLLGSLLQALDLHGDSETILDNAEFGNRRYLERVLDSAWELHATLQYLSPSSPSSLSDGILRMRAVRERRAHLASNAHNFVLCASKFIAGQFHESCKTVLLEEVQSDFQNGTLSNSQRHSHLNRFGGLVEVIKALEPTCLVQLRMEYARIVNSLLRRQLRACAGIMRAGAKLAVSQAPPEADITFRRLSTSRRRSQTQLPNLDGSGHRTRILPGEAQSMRAGKTLDRLPTMMLGQSLADVEARHVDEAYAMLLDTFVPLLLKEASFAVELLLLSRAEEGRQGRRPRSRMGSDHDEGQSPQASSRPHPSSTSTKSSRRLKTQNASRQEHQELGAHGLKVIEQLLEGVEDDVMHLVDLTSKGQQQLCVPMLGSTLRHQAKVSGVPHAVPLQLMLTNCEKVLRANLEGFVAERVSNINKFEASSTMTSGSKVKHVHLMPFIEDFGPFVTRLEDFLWRCKLDDDAERPSRPSTPGSRQEENPSALTDAATSDGYDTSEPTTPHSHVSQEASMHPPGDDGPISLRARFVGTGGLSVARTSQVRAVLDDAYNRLIRAMIGTIERLAASDTKYGNKLRLENYSGLLDAIHHHANSVTTLANFRDGLEKSKEAAVQGYVREQLEYCRIWALLSFSEKLEKILPDVGPADVKFQMHFTPDDLKQLLGSTMSGAEKKLGMIHGRIAKHFSSQPSKFVQGVWSRCQEALVQCYQRLEGQIRLCYPGIVLSPTTEGLIEMLDAASSR